jgi:DNA-directed RNA polymerase specialized sigma subunit
VVDQERDAEALRRFESTLELVEIVARQIGRVVGRGIELDELLSFGREGLLDAARRFDADRACTNGCADSRPRRASTRERSKI